MMHLEISRSWLFSPVAQHVYFACAVLDLAFLGTRIAILAAMAAADVAVLPLGVASLLKLLLYPEIVGTAVLLVGMSYCWLGIEASYRKKVLWFLLLAPFLITMPIYYFAFYRQMAAREAGSRRARAPVSV
jgi:hypothetical protein